MSHNIEYFDYEENVDRNRVQKELDDFAAHEDWQEVCTGLGAKIRWIERVGVCKDYEEAQKMIDQNDKGWYSVFIINLMRMGKRRY